MRWWCRRGELGRPRWEGVSLKLLEGTPVLAIEPPDYCSKAVVDFVRERLAQSQNAAREKAVSAGSLGNMDQDAKVYPRG